MLNKNIKDIIVNIINDNYIIIKPNMLLFMLDAVEDFIKTYKTMKVIQEKNNHVIMLDEGIGNVVVILEDSTFDIVMFNTDKSISIVYYKEKDSLNIAVKINDNKKDYIVCNVTNYDSTIKIKTEKILTIITFTTSNLMNALYDYESGIKRDDINKTSEYITKVEYRSNTMETYEELKEKALLMKQTSLNSAIFYTDEDDKLHILN